MNTTFHISLLLYENTYLYIMKFHRILVSREALKLENVLQAGQAFRWIWDEKNDLYMTSILIPGYDKYGIIILRQKQIKKEQGDEYIEFAFKHPTWEYSCVENYLKQYFRLEVDLVTQLGNWTLKDPNFLNISSQGIRILSQEPWETLISFICSSNNNISRITKMCHNLSTYYGNKIGKFNDMEFYSFPTSEQLIEKATEQELRDLGFGYRAKYIIETARKMIQDQKRFNVSTDQEVLFHISKNFNYEKIREHLMSYTGVGPKVADCVCLMGLHLDHIVPVDVHVMRFAKRDYNIAATKTELAKIRELYNSLNLPITKKKINPELDFIRRKLTEKWGPFAGWAQGILFSKEVGSTAGATVAGDVKKRKRSFDEVDNVNSSITMKKSITAPKIEA